MSRTVSQKQECTTGRLSKELLGPLKYEVANTPPQETAGVKEQVLPLSANMKPGTGFGHTTDWKPGALIGWPALSGTDRMLAGTPNAEIDEMSIRAIDRRGSWLLNTRSSHGILVIVLQRDWRVVGLAENELSQVIRKGLQHKGESWKSWSWEVANLL